MIKIGKNIKKLREKKSITQEKLANYLGVTPQAISRWESETGYPDIELLPMIADFFDVTIDDLLDRNILQNKNEIKEGIKEIDRLHSLGESNKRKELIIELYNKYPYNFELMNYYIWILAYDEEMKSMMILKNYVHLYLMNVLTNKLDIPQFNAYQVITIIKVKLKKR